MAHHSCYNRFSSFEFSTIFPHCIWCCDVWDIIFHSCDFLHYYHLFVYCYLKIVLHRASVIGLKMFCVHWTKSSAMKFHFWEQLSSFDSSKLRIRGVIYLTMNYEFWDKVKIFEKCPAKRRLLKNCDSLLSSKMVFIEKFIQTLSVIFLYMVKGGYWVVRGLIKKSIVIGYTRIET